MQSTNDILSNNSKKQSKSDIESIKKDDTKRSIEQDNIPSSSIEKLWGGSSSVSEVSMSDYFSTSDLSEEDETPKRSDKMKESEKIGSKNDSVKLKKKKKKNNHSSSLSDLSDDSDSEISSSKKKLNSKEKIKKFKKEYPDLIKKKKSLATHEKKIKKNMYSDDSDNNTTNEFEPPKRRGRPRKKKLDKIKSQYENAYSSYTSSDDDMSSIHYNNTHKKQNKTDIHQIATANRYHQNKKQNQEEMLYIGDDKKRKHIPVSQINVPDRSGQTPIFKFARGDIKACQALIDAGADLNIKDYAGWTPLHEACLEGQLDIVKLMIRYGADVNACAQNLDTPLHDASENGHVDVVEYLLANGAIINAKNDKGNAPIDVVRDESEVKEVLIKWDKMLEKIKKVDDTGQTVLHQVVINDDIEGLREYLKYGANVNATDYAGWTPLHEACLSGHYDCAEELLLHGASFNTPGPDGDYPLHEASINGHEKIIKLLLSFGANPDQLNEQTKQTPKTLARNPACLKLLSEDLSKYKPFRKSKYAITYIAPLDGSGNIDYNNAIDRGPNHDVNVMYSASSDTSHTVTTYQRGGGTWTNVSGGIRVPESMNSVSIDGGNHFSSSRDERKFRALLHQIDEIDKKEKKRKHNNEHHDNTKVKKKLKSLKEKSEKSLEKSIEKESKSSSKDLKYESDNEETMKPVLKKKEKLKHDLSSNTKKEDESVDRSDSKIKEKETNKSLSEKHKSNKSKYKSSIPPENSNTSEEKIKKTHSTKEKLKEIMNSSNINNESLDKKNKHDGNNESLNNNMVNDTNSKKHRSTENNTELDEEETIDVVETATPTYAEEPIIDNDDLLLSSDLGLMYTRQRSTRKNINYDLTSETSTPQLSPTAQHSIGDYDMSWAEDMSFLKTIKEDKTDGDWLDTSKKSSSNGSRRKRRSTRSNDTDDKEKTQSNENSGSKKIKSEKSSKSGESSVKRRRLVSGSTHSVSETASTHHSHQTKSDKGDQEVTTKVHKVSKKEKEKLKEKLKERGKEKEKRKEKEKEKEKEKGKEREKEKEKVKDINIETIKLKEKEKTEEKEKEKTKENDSSGTTKLSSKKKTKKWNFLGISGYQKVNNSDNTEENNVDSKDNIQKETVPKENEMKSEEMVTSTIKKEVEDSKEKPLKDIKIEKESKDPKVNILKTENISTKIKSEPIKSEPTEDSVEIKATIIPVNDEVTKSKYKTYSAEDSYIDQIKPDVDESGENISMELPTIPKKSRAQLKQENRERKLSEMRKQLKSQSSQPSPSTDNDVKEPNNKENSLISPTRDASKPSESATSFTPNNESNPKNLNSDDLLRTPSPKPDKNIHLSSYSNSPSSVSTPSALPLLDIENMSSKFRAEDIRERKLVKSVITNYRKCRCLPLYSFKLPARETITNILLASQGQTLPKKKEKNDNVRYVTDIQIGLFLGYKSGRELLDKYPMLKKRVATLAEKERLENSPISELIVNCLLSIPDTKKWNKFDKQLKLTDLDIQFLKLDEVMTMIIKQEHFDQILQEEIEEISRKVSKAAGERFRSLQQNQYLESTYSGTLHPSKSSSSIFPYSTISNKMMLLTIDVDLLSFPSEKSWINPHPSNNSNPSKSTSTQPYYNPYHPLSNNPSRNNSPSHSETSTPNSIKFNKNDTPYRNGFKKSFIKYQQQLSSLALNANSVDETTMKPLQSSYQKSQDKTIHHPPIQIHSTDFSSSPTHSFTANTSSPIQSPSNTSSYTKEYPPSENPIPSQSQPPPPPSSSLLPSSSPTTSTTVNTFIHKIEKINKALPLKAKFKLATKENL